MVIIFICSSRCDEQQCFLENFPVVLCETSIKIFRYLTHEKYVNSFFTEFVVSAIFYCSNAVTKKLGAMKIPLGYSLDDKNQLNYVPEQKGKPLTVLLHDVCDIS